MEAVTGVLVERAATMRGLPRMVTVSAIGHAVLAAGVVAWSVFVGRAPADEIRPVMTISLGGAPGPQAGGMTMAGRPIQTTAALPDVRRPEPLRPEASSPPAMTLPDPKARAPRRPAKPVAAAAGTAARPAPPAPRGNTRAGQAAEPDPNRGMGFGGLSTGGGGAGGYLDVQNFCCPDYLVTMLQVVQRNWNARQEVGGESLVRFRIQRDGRITDIELERSSGYAALDLTAQRALFLTQRVPSLPSAFPDDQLTVHLRFQYQR